MSDEELDSGGTPPADKKDEDPDVDLLKRQEVLRLNRRKRACKRNATRIRYQLEKVSSQPPKTDQEIKEIECSVDQMWDALEEIQDVLDEISCFHLLHKEYDSQQAVMKESDEVEIECQQAIEKAQLVLTQGIIVQGPKETSPPDTEPKDGKDSSSDISASPTDESSTTPKESPVVPESAEKEQSDTSGVESPSPQSDQPVSPTKHEDSTSPKKSPVVPGTEKPVASDIESPTSQSHQPASPIKHEDSTTPKKSPVKSPGTVKTEKPETSGIESPSPQANQPLSPTKDVKTEESKAPKFNQRLKPLKVPTYDGDKTKFEEFWALFESLVDQSDESPSLKMARLRQSLTGNAVLAIRGLGVSAPEYEEAKEILKTKFGGHRRQLRAYLDELEKLPALRNTDVQGFERFADLVRVTVVKLQAEGKDGELGDGTLHSLLVKKLTERQLESYTRWLSEHHCERSVVSLRNWLKEEVSIRVEAVEMAHGVDGKVTETMHSQRAPRSNDRNKPRSFFAAGNTSKPNEEREMKRKPPCVFCSGSTHGIWNCRQFQKEDVKNRWNFAKEKQLCFRCLSKDHRGKDCRRSQHCGVEGCQLNHHHLLHRPGNPSSSGAESAPVVPREGVQQKPPPVSMVTRNSEKYTERYSLRTVPVWLKANGRKVKVNAILDDASNETFLNEDVASVLGLKEPFQTVRVQVLNNSVETFQSMPLKLEIESLSGEFVKKIEVRSCPRQVTGNYKAEDWNTKKDKWPHLTHCDFPKPAEDKFVDLLIGIDNTELHFSFSDIRGRPGEPIARLGPLGWTCIGVTGQPVDTAKRSHLLRSFLARDASQSNHVNDCCDVNATLRKFWEVENYGMETTRVTVMTQEEKEALDKVSSSLENVGSRYRIAIPWKKDNPQLPENRSSALNRLESTEKKLNSKDDFVKKEYQETLKAYVEKGYLRKVLPSDGSPPAKWYLPHFPIIRMDKTTTKVRIVFDCSAKHDGQSLNDVIHAGPKLHTELFDVLVRFRRNPVGIVCDIKEMYLQIEIEEKDRPYFRILWRDYESDREPDEYEFTRVVFGKNSAPMEAQFVAQENARRHQDQYPLAAETVIKSTYMDDSIDSVEDESTAMELYTQLQSLWNIAGMQARKWVSNSKQVIATIPEEFRATEIVINSEDPVTKTLGIAWSSTDDMLTVSSGTRPSLQRITKRQVLKKIATVFDPLGLVSPVVITGKMLLQMLWTRGYDWDDEIEDDTVHQIEQWFQQIPDVSEVKIPRCIRQDSPVKSVKLVTFVDASTSAYGAVIYARYKYEDPALTSCRLIASKGRVTPLVSITVPRLELMAAVVGLRLTQTVIRVLEVPLEKVAFYSDSLDVLWWIRGHGKSFRPFVANRVGEIQMASDPSQWHHVPTDQNPADLISRGTSAASLAVSSLWWNGPEWLLSDEKHWPKLENNPPEVMKETKKTSVALLSRINPPDCTTKKNNVEEWRLDPKRFSSWTRLVRIHARVIRVLYNMQSKKDRVGDVELLPEEILDAEEDIIRQAQREAFAEEYKSLRSNNPVSPKSPLVKLSPKIDENGIIRMEGRLMYAEYLPYDVKYPIILPRAHHVTKLIVKHYHEMANHTAGVNFILSQVSQRFWIIAAREEIRSWENECNKCKKRRTKLATQVMAPLPQVRLRFSLRPFDQCALDYAGPFETVQARGRARQKRWLCLFTCVCTRAIHLEMAWGLDTDSFLNAFTRFTSRRGVPSEVVSDNGTNFVGAVNELRELVSKLDKDLIQRKTTNIFKKVVWHFNPPAAPHFGGIHEAMIKSAKKAIYGVLGSNDIKDEELITVFTGVESLLNSRPLTYQSSDPKDVTPLTPNHFLHGMMGGEVAPEAVDTTDFNLKKRWRKVQQIISQVWSRWLSEYIPTLNKRQKWTEIVKDLKEGDVVLALEPNLPRGRWPLGRIIATYPGKDGHTRVAKVQCGTKTVVRPIHKLVPLLSEN